MRLSAATTHAAEGYGRDLQNELLEQYGLATVGPGPYMHPAG